MVKIIVKKDLNFKSKSRGERKALAVITSAQESYAYRETKAADIPVTYVSRGLIVKEHNGKIETIGNVAPKVRVVEIK